MRRRDLPSRDHSPPSADPRTCSALLSGHEEVHGPLAAGAVFPARQEDDPAIHREFLAVLDAVCPGTPGTHDGIDRGRDPRGVGIGGRRLARRAAGAERQEADRQQGSGGGPGDRRRRMGGHTKERLPRPRSGRGCGTRVGRAQCCRRWFALPRDAGRRPAPGELASAPGEGGALALAGRSVVGAGFALPRDAGRRPALQAPRFFAVGESRSRCASRSRAAVKPHREEQCHRCWFRAPARCRSETGAPGGWGIRVGMARCCRCWFRAPARCRSETGAPGGWGTRVGRARCCRRWFRAPARCRSETGAPGRPRAFSRWARDLAARRAAAPR